MKRKVKLCVVSDVHLGTRASAASELNDYLKAIQPEVLVLNGDIIDGWRFSRRYWPKSHIKVVRRILKMSERGTLVYVLPGNHDEALRQYAPFSFGNIHLMHKLVLQLDGKSVVFFHGDVFDLIMRYSKWLGHLGAWAYDALIWVNTWVNRARSGLGLPRSSFSATVKNSVKSAVKFVSDFEETCASYAEGNGHDVVVCGHVHQPADRVLGRVRYLNSGDWVESLTALEYSDGRWTLYRHKLDVEVGSDDDEFVQFDLLSEMNVTKHG